MTPYEKAVDKFKGKKILIFGLGLLGGAVGDARFFSLLGANVRVTDEKSEIELASSIEILKDVPIEYRLGGTQTIDIDWADVIIRNPSVPINHPLLQYARTTHKCISMRSSLFVELANIFTIGITGTRGKSTTTALIYELVKQFSGKHAILAGNIAGISDLELLSTIKDSDNTIAVMELSSWQLQGFAESEISPNIAVLTNLYPDHLNKYPDIASYYEDKKNIMKYQHSSDAVLFNQDVTEFKTWAISAKGQVLWYSKADLPNDLVLSIPGDHNRANGAAALKVAEHLGYPLPSACNTVSTFRGVPFRLETIANKAGVIYINDTTSTTPIATIAALKTINKPIIICGGADKNLPINDMVMELNTKTKAIILLPGTGTERLKSLLDHHLVVGEATSMAEAVSYATAAASPGDTVILSPGFASFGLFNNEFDRGNQFNQCVQTRA